ncbi:MAG: TlpA family protein disulfide reductase [Hyphomonadaceae bacterium]|nr:TlpA family protein disulfide reductase [Hyphomonadaceae bacterium]
MTLKAAGWLGLFGLLAALYVLFTAVSKPADETSLKRFATGEMQKLVVVRDPPAQPLNVFFDATGAERRLSDFRGKVVLVNLWATWCAPCIEEMPTLAALADGYRGREFELVAISVDRNDMKARAQSDLKKLAGESLDFYQDPGSAIAFEVKAQGMPTTILYDRSGREIARLAGAADWSSAEARALVDAALGE